MAFIDLAAPRTLVARLCRTPLYNWMMRTPVVGYSLFVLTHDIFSFCTEAAAHPIAFREPDSGVAIAVLARVSPVDVYPASGNPPDYSPACRSQLRPYLAALHSSYRSRFDPDVHAARTSAGSSGFQFRLRINQPRRQHDVSRHRQLSGALAEEAVLACAFPEFLAYRRNTPFLLRWDPVRFLTVIVVDPKAQQRSALIAGTTVAFAILALFIVPLLLG